MIKVYTHIINTREHPTYTRLRNICSVYGVHLIQRHTRETFVIQKKYANKPEAVFIKHALEKTYFGLMLFTLAQRSK